MTKAKRFSLLDAFIVFGALLIVLGMIGQSVSVRLYERWQKSESYAVSFAIHSCDRKTALLLVEEQAKRSSVSCYYGEKAVGYLSRVKVKDLLAEDGGEEAHQTLCDLTGTVILYGREKDGNPFFYGIGRAEVGDTVLLSLEKRVYAFEITDVNALNVKKNEKPT
jgi:sortase (surface protein transpeptidase)